MKAIEHLLQDTIDKAARNKNLRNIIMSVQSGDGTFSWSGTAMNGITNGIPISADTPFFIASIDKCLNAAIVLMLAEQGRIRLDDSPELYIPAKWLKGLTAKHNQGAYGKAERLTIRHLLAHASGIADWIEDSPKGGTSLVERVLSEGDRLLSLEEIFTHVADRLTPHFPVQNLDKAKVRIRYSDTNYMLVIAILEAVCGKPLPLIQQEYFLKPLGMNHVWTPGMSEPLAETRQSVPLRAGGRAIHIPRMLESFRGIYATADDLIRFLRHLVQTDGTMFRTMSASWNRFGFPTDMASLRSPNWPIQYGLGLMRFEIPPVFTGFKSLPALVGHTGSTGSWLFWCPEHDLYFAGSVDEITAGALPFRLLPNILSRLNTVVY